MTGINLLRPQAGLFPPTLQPNLLEPVSSRWGLAFGGVDQYVNCGNDPSLNITGALAIQCVVRVNSLAASQDVLSNGRYKYGGYALRVASSGAVVLLTNVSGTQSLIITASGVITTGTVYRVCAYCDGTNGYIYVDGVEKKNAALPFAAETTFPFIIGGGGSSGTSNNFDGDIFDIRVYRRVLGSSEIFTYNGDYQNYRNFQALEGWWRFNEGHGTSIRDWSGKGNEGTMDGFSGDPWINEGIR
ncbi:MAG: LamG-like jellyroll fold domain-containing protein [bacterium]